MYQDDQALRNLLGENPNSYSVEEKLSIIQAYKKGGGVQGLEDIIIDDDEEEEGAAGEPTDPAQQRAFNGEQADIQNEGHEDEEEQELDIDLENPDDVKLID